MNNWQDLDLEETIHEYDYTRRAVYNMNRIMDAADFESMDAEKIFKYLSEEMDIVIFPDFLKRYIYEKTEIDSPFKDVQDPVYQEIIASSFEYNNAPFSLKETKVRNSLMIKRWLTQESVRRDTVFILGFGLKMPVEDVSMFLTKVIKEDDFDFTDPEETILWYCFKRGLPYVQYRKLLARYVEMPAGKSNDKTWSSMSSSPEFFLTDQKNLLTYLNMLKAMDISAKKQQTAFDEFMRLYEMCCGIIKNTRMQEAELVDDSVPADTSPVMPGDIERELCSGIPFNGKGNLEPMTRSRFLSLFENKRMSRQRIAAILNRSRPVERFDLITLLFFIYAETVEPDWPAERYLRFIDDINGILHKCGMSDIYPVNPYESFVLMCLVTDFPLDVYAEIWEKSYE